MRELLGKHNILLVSFCLNYRKIVPKFALRERSFKLHEKFF